MKHGVPVDGVSLKGGTSPGISISVDSLVLTGVRHDTPASMLGDVVTEVTEEPDYFRYRIEVEGTAIRENYEYEEHKEAGHVAADWLTDVKETWGDEIGDAFQGHVQVTDLWRQTTVDTDSEAQAESQKESQTQETPPLGSEDNPVALGPPPEEERQE